MSTSSLQAEALGLLRYNIWSHLDAAEHHALKNNAFQSDEDLETAADLIPNLVDVIREVIHVHERSGIESEASLRTLETIYHMVKDPKHEFVKLARRYEFT
jgi:hypothetical protein